MKAKRQDSSKGDVLAFAAENGVFLVMSVAGIFISSLDMLGLVNSNSFLGKNIAEVTMFMVSGLCLYTCLAKRNATRSIINKGEEIEADVTADLSIIKSLISAQGTSLEFIRFDNAEDQMMYQTDRIREAKHSVDDLTWSHSTGLAMDLSRRKEIEDMYEGAIASAAMSIAYREIFIFNKEFRREKLKRRIAENAPGYSCAFFLDVPIPRMQFVIIDQKEVIFSSDALPFRFAIKHVDVSTSFSAYYDDLWRSAIIIKAGNEIIQHAYRSALEA